MTNLRLNRGELTALIELAETSLQADFMFAETDKPAETPLSAALAKLQSQLATLD